MRFIRVGDWCINPEFIKAVMSGVEQIDLERGRFVVHVFVTQSTYDPIRFMNDNANEFMRQFNALDENAPKGEIVKIGGAVRRISE